jgi:1-pyrroline-5-carboxylate dehydrogenase
MASLPSWATVDPVTLSGANPGQGFNLVNGEWRTTAKTEPIVDPMNGDVFLHMPLTQKSELAPFVESMATCPKHGLHNPFKNVERYVLDRLGGLCRPS